MSKIVDGIVKDIKSVPEKAKAKFKGGNLKKLQKSHPLNCRCDTFVNITSPTQLQDGTTYDSNNIIHHICMKSTEIYSEISAFSSISSSLASSLLSQVVNFSFTGYEKFLPIFWNPYSVK